jgi:pimeloyl-ACP methyl ester carboxylesterase
VAQDPVLTRKDFLFLFFEPSVQARTLVTRSGSVGTGAPSTWTLPRPNKPCTLRRRPLGSGANSAVKRFADLQRIKQPTLVVNGSHDIMVPTINSYILSQRIPDAQLILYPDSGQWFAVPVRRIVRYSR